MKYSNIIKLLCLVSVVITLTYIISQNKMINEKLSIIAYTTTDIANKENAKSSQNEIPKDAYARLIIPEINISVALYNTSFYSQDQNQQIVDKEDSAAFISDGGTCNVIADHTHQGFSNIKYAKPNETLAYINHGTYSDTYMCTYICVGTNNEEKVLDDTNTWIAKKENQDIAMYTCNEDWRNVTITYWKKVK